MPPDAERPPPPPDLRVGPPDAERPPDPESPPDLRVGPPHGPDRGEAFTFTFDGEAVNARPGETIGAALLAAGVRRLRGTRLEGRPRGLHCGIGSCFDCVVTVDGVGGQRACLTPAEAGAQVEVGDVPHLR